MSSTLTVYNALALAMIKSGKWHPIMPIDKSKPVQEPDEGASEIEVSVEEFQKGNLLVDEVPVLPEVNRLVESDRFYPIPVPELEDVPLDLEVDLKDVKFSAESDLFSLPDALLVQAQRVRAIYVSEAATLAVRVIAIIALFTYNNALKEQMHFFWTNKQRGDVVSNEGRLTREEKKEIMDSTKDLELDELEECIFEIGDKLQRRIPVCWANNKYNSIEYREKDEEKAEREFWQDFA